MERDFGPSNREKHSISVGVGAKCQRVRREDLVIVVKPFMPGIWLQSLRERTNSIPHLCTYVVAYFPASAWCTLYIPPPMYIVAYSAATIKALATTLVRTIPRYLYDKREETRRTSPEGWRKASLLPSKRFVHVVDAAQSSSPGKS